MPDVAPVHRAEGGSQQRRERACARRWPSAARLGETGRGHVARACVAASVGGRRAWRWCQVGGAPSPRGLHACMGMRLTKHLNRARASARSQRADAGSAAHAVSSIDRTAAHSVAAATGGAPALPSRAGGHRAVGQRMGCAQRLAIARSRNSVGELRVGAGRRARGRRRGHGGGCRGGEGEEAAREANEGVHKCACARRRWWRRLRQRGGARRCRATAQRVASIIDGFWERACRELDGGDHFASYVFRPSWRGPWQHCASPPVRPLPLRDCRWSG